MPELKPHSPPTEAEITTPSTKVTIADSPVSYRRIGSFNSANLILQLISESRDGFTDISLAPVADSSDISEDFHADLNAPAFHSSAIALVSLAAINAIVSGFRRYFKQQHKQALLETAGDADTTNKTILASTLTYDYNDNFEPYFVALRKQPQTATEPAQLYLARIKLTAEQVQAYLAADDSQRESLKAGYEDLASGELTSLTPPITDSLTKAQRFWRRFMGTNLFGFSVLVQLGSWFSTVNMIGALVVGATATAAALGPFGALGIALAATTLYFGFKAFSIYRRKNNPALDPRDQIMLEVLAKSKSIDRQLAKKTDELSEIETHLKTQGVNTSKNFDLSQLAVAPGNINNPVAKARVSTTKRNRLIAIATASGFVAGFIAAYIAMKPILALLGSFLHGAALAGLTGIPGAIIPIAISVVIGAAFAYSSYKAAKLGDNKTNSALDKLLGLDKKSGKTNPAQLTEKLVSLDSELTQKRQALAALKAKIENNPKLKELIGNSRFDVLTQRFTARLGDEEFMKSLRQSSSSTSARYFNILKRAIANTILFLGNGSSGATMVQIFFGVIGTALAGSLLSNPFTLAGLGIAIAFAVIGWGTAKLFQHHANKQNAKTEKLLNEISVHLDSKSAENKLLDNQLRLLQGLVEHSPAASHTVADMATKSHSATNNPAPSPASVATIPAVNVHSAETDASNENLGLNTLFGELDDEFTETPNTEEPATLVRKNSSASTATMYDENDLVGEDSDQSPLSIYSDHAASDDEVFNLRHLFGDDETDEVDANASSLPNDSASHGTEPEHVVKIEFAPALSPADLAKHLAVSKGLNKSATAAPLTATDGKKINIGQIFSRGEEDEGGESDAEDDKPKERVH